MLATLYLKSQCPKCSTINWIFWDYLLDPDDTRPISDAIECHHCNFLWLIDEEDWIDMHLWSIVDDVDCPPEASEAPGNIEDWAAEQLEKFKKSGRNKNGKDLQYFIKEHANAEMGKEIP